MFAFKEDASMLPSPFHERTREACISYLWKDWSGYYAVRRYGQSAEREYNAVRQAVSVMDVTPLFKYEVTGPGAGRCLSRVLVRGVTKQKVGRMRYLCWCDGRGKVLDDGTVARLGEEHYRVTSGAPAFHWLARLAEDFDVAVEDVSRRLAALAVQGPASRALLGQICDAPLDELGYFRIAPARFDGGEGWVSRTGYTGDLGYELWVPNDQALALWDAVTAAGPPYGLEPIGLDTLDVVRIEAGYVLRGVDYVGANEALIDAQTSSPFELGLGWTVRLGGRAVPCVGQPALAREKAEGSAWSLVGVEIDWAATEALYDEHGLPPQVPAAAWRASIPIYAEGAQVGYATSGTWSPLLKKNIALATLRSEHAATGTPLHIEHTVEHRRYTLPAVVRSTPFFDPERKRA